MSYFDFPAIPGRIDTTVSFEQELPSSVYDIADAIGMSYGGYHGGEGRHDGTSSVYIEEDGSCGAEVIYSTRRLSDAHDAQRVRNTWSQVREASYRVNTACGFHIHVDPRPCDFNDLASLYHLWNGVEDVLYRLGGAGYTRGHRGESYCPKTPKGSTRHVDVSESMAGGRFGLNLSRVIRAMMSCRCGAARVGKWSECRCEPEGATVEFRVWNGTRNARKAHAYIALSLGMVSESQRISYSPKRCGVLEWNGEGSRHPAARTRKALERVLDLPMTAFDRETVMYLVWASSLPTVIGQDGMSAIHDRYGITPQEAIRAGERTGGAADEYLTGDA